MQSANVWYVAFVSKIKCDLDHVCFLILILLFVNSHRVYIAEFGHIPLLTVFVP
jgi:hypothetical protein